MAHTPHKSISLFAALVSATGTARAMDYFAHFEWHFPLTFVGTDALIMAAFLETVLGLKLLFPRQRKSGS